MDNANVAEVDGARIQPKAKPRIGAYCRMIRDAHTQISAGLT